jgi:hypothetical protein
VDGLSLDMLWVLDRDGILCGGEATPEDGRDLFCSKWAIILAISGLVYRVVELGTAQMQACCFPVGRQTEDGWCC